MLKDSEFISNSKVPGPTKEEIRCLVMCKSNIKSTDTVLEIGCGTGGLTLEFARRCEKVYSVDKNPDAISLTSQNLKNHDLEGKVELFEAEALDAIDKVNNFDVLMIGGSGGDLPKILEKCCEKISEKKKIIVTAILIETKTEAISTLKRLGYDIEVVEVNIARGKILNRGTMMFAENPIAIIYTI